MAEKAAEHEIETGTKVVEGVFAERRRGQLAGAVVVISVLACSGWALYLGYESFAMTLGGWTLVGIAAIFVLGRLPHWFRAFRSPQDESRPSQQADPDTGEPPGRS